MTDRPELALEADDAAWVASRVEAGEAESENAYLARLIERDRRNHAKLEQMREWVREGLESGVSDMTMEDIWREAQARVRADGKDRDRERAQAAGAL